MFDKDILDLGGRAVLAAADDRVVLAPANELVGIDVRVGHAGGSAPDKGRTTFNYRVHAAGSDEHHLSAEVFN